MPPLACNHLKSIGRGSVQRFLGGLFRAARVNALGEQLLGLIAQFAGVFQRDLGVCAEREQFFRTPEAILEPPELSPFGGDEEEQTTAVKKLLSLVCGFCSTDGGIGQAHILRHK